MSIHEITLASLVSWRTNDAMRVEVSCIFHVSVNLLVGAFFVEEGGVGKPEDKSLSQCILCVWRTHLTCYIHSLYVFLHLSLSSINSANVSMQIKSTKWTKCHFKHAKRPAEDTLTFTSDSCIARHSIREARRLIWDDRQNEELSISIHVIRVTFILHVKLFAFCCWEISLHRSSQDQRKSGKQPRHLPTEESNNKLDEVVVSKTTKHGRQNSKDLCPRCDLLCEKCRDRSFKNEKKQKRRKRSERRIWKSWQKAS